MTKRGVYRSTRRPNQRAVPCRMFRVSILIVGVIASFSPNLGYNSVANIMGLSPFV